MIIQDSTIATNGLMALVDPNNLIEAYRTQVNGNGEIEMSQDVKDEVTIFITLENPKWKCVGN